MACPKCGVRATGTLRFGDSRPRIPKPPSLVLENHFPRGSYDLCEVSEIALEAQYWPEWATTAVAQNEERKAGKK